MMTSALLVLAATAGAPPTAGNPKYVPTSGVSARGEAIVRLIQAAVIPMSAGSDVVAPQRLTIIHLADGDHTALIVEFQ